MRSRSVAGVLALFGALSACRGKVADTPAPPIQRVYDYGMSFGGSRAKIRAALGAPETADTSLVQNRHVEGARDSLFTLTYPGIRFALNRPEPVDEEFLTSVRLSSGEESLPGGLRVGKTKREAVVTLLGAPGDTSTRADTTVLSYEVPGEGADRFVDFLLTADTLRAVVWAPYVD